MDKIINKYKKAAYLSDQTIVHFKHLLSNDDIILVFLDVKHIQDTKYKPTIVPIPNSIDFEKGFQKVIISLCEQLQPNLVCAQQSIKAKEKVSFSDTVHVRVIGSEQIDYTVQLV